MSVEETLVQQFQEFRKWQMQQEEKLLQHQKEQRESLSDEQNRVYEALSLSMDEINFNDQSLKCLAQPEESNLIDLETPDEDCVIPTIEKNNNLSEKLILTNDNNCENLGLDLPNMNLTLKNTAVNRPESSLDYTFDHLESLSDLSKTDLQSCFSDKSYRSSIPIDEIPLPSPKRDFETLLEEKLKNSEEIVNQNNFKPAVKKPFLKKGEGLARFKPSPDKKNLPKCTLKSKRLSLPSCTQAVNKQYHTPNSEKCVTLKSQINNSKRKSLPNIPPVAQEKLTLKNVPLPKKKNVCKPIDYKSDKFSSKDKKASKFTSDPSSSDLEIKNKREQEEVRIFELLEDKAENSSFCSTSSTVIAFLQQSTPLKHKALLHSATKHKLSFNDVGDQTLEEIIQSTKSNQLPQLPENIEDQNLFEWESLPTLKSNKTSNQIILPYGTDVDDYENYSSNNCVNDEENESLHVRFAEQNEYKNITDNSSVSSGSQTILNYADDKGAWSDCSATDSSDTESNLLFQLQKENAFQSLHNIKSLDFLTSNFINSNDNNTESYNQEVDSEAENDLKDATLCTDSAENDEKNSTLSLLKSELLKSRLVELDQEIEIFRKENAALTFQRQKLQEERTKLQEERISLQRSFKEKKEALEIEKKNAESILQDERKRLSREKAALENRLKDAYEKSQKSKQERQEIQALRDQLDELREEYRQKENKWTATNARQRSQMRVLQTENARLKQELDKLQQQKNARFKKVTSSNTKAIHQINKALANRKKTSPFKNEEIFLEGEDKVPELDDFIRKLDLEVPKDNESDQEIERQKIAKTAQSIARTRDLYESLLRDAVEDFSDVQVEKKNLMNLKTDDKENELNVNNSVGEDNSVNTQCKSLEPSENTLDESKNEKTNKVDQKINTKKQDIREVHHPDGHIEYWYPNGNVKKVFPDINLSKIIYYNGDVRINEKDGTIKYFYASSRTWHTTKPDKSEIFEYPDGQIEKKANDGTIEVMFTDGSLKVVRADGSEKWTLSDGTIAETTVDGDKVVIFPNGQREIHTKDSKRREYPDGTVKFVYPDGVQETRYANGRIRLKDKDGNLIMDSYQQ